jgi:hypothetical protein
MVAKSKTVCDYTKCFHVFAHESDLCISARPSSVRARCVGESHLQLAFPMLLCDHLTT